jgi:hypothetical protein
MRNVEQLAASLGFTMADLALNRVGRLSGAQTWMSVKALGLSATFLILVVVAVPAFLLIKPRPSFLLVVIALCCGCVGIVAGGYLTWRDLRAAIAHRAVCAEGNVQLLGGTRGTHVRIGSFDGVLPTGALTAVELGAKYRVYFLPASDAFLSIEPAPSTESDKHDP